MRFGWRRLRQRPFVSGVLSGIVLIFALRLFINETPVADWIVAPLLADDTAGSADAIVVAGAGVTGECIPNHTGTRRVLRAAKLWREQRAPFLVIPGASEPGRCPVAVAMAQMAQEIGVPASHLRVETSSRSTWENAAFLAPALRGWGVRRILLVTDRLHMRRAASAFEAQGFAVERSSVPIYEGHPDNVSMLRAGVREFAAFAYYWIRGWTTVARDGRHRPTQARSAMPEFAGRNSGSVVVLGASYAQGWKLTDVGGIPVINKGIAGQQSFELLERFDRDVAAAQPRAVLIWGFINDIFRAPVGNLPAALARVRSSYEQMVARAKQQGITPILGTEVTARPRAGLMDTFAGWAAALRGKEAYQDVINHDVLATNQWLAQFAEHEGLLLLDFQSVLSEPGGRRRKPFAQADGSHISEAGYDMLTAYSRPILEEYFRAR